MYPEHQIINNSESITTSTLYIISLTYIFYIVKAHTCLSKLTQTQTYFKEIVTVENVKDREIWFNSQYSVVEGSGTVSRSVRKSD